MEREHQELAAGLGRLAPEVDTDEGLKCVQQVYGRRRRRRRAMTGTLAVTILLGAGVAAVAVSVNRDDPDGDLASEPPGQQELSFEGWVELAPGPFARDFEAVGSVWTGEEAIWWGTVGGSAEAFGAAYNPHSETWREISQPPIRARSSPAVVWTGKEMVVWGGHDWASGMPAAGATYDSEAVAYDPGADTWRTITPAPIQPRERTAAVWTGSEVLVSGGTRFDGPTECSGLESCLEQGLVGLPGAQPRPDGAAYDPAGDRWRTIADAPALIADLQAATWTGDRVLVFGRDPGGLAYEPASDTWQTLSRRTDRGPDLVQPLVTAAAGTAIALEIAAVPGNEDGVFVYSESPDVWVRSFGIRGPETNCLPIAAKAGDLVAATGCLLALYSDESGSWIPIPLDGAPDAVQTAPGFVLASDPVGFDGGLLVLGINIEGERQLVGYGADMRNHEVPDVEGLAVTDALQVLSRAGLEGRVSEGDPTGPDAVVRVQEPPAGTQAPGIAPFVGLRTETVR